MFSYEARQYHNRQSLGWAILQQAATISGGSFPAWHCHEEHPLSREEATPTAGSHYHRADTIVTGGQSRTGSHYHVRQPLSQQAASIPKGSSYLKRQLQGPMSQQALTQPFPWSVVIIKEKMQYSLKGKIIKPCYLPEDVSVSLPITCHPSCRGNDDPMIGHIGMSVFLCNFTT